MVRRHIPVEDSYLRNLYLVEMKSIPDISNLISIPKSTIRSHMIRIGIRLRKYSEATQSTRNKISMANTGKKRGPMSMEARKKMSIERLARGEKYAKGISLKPNGYYEITRGPNKGRSLHVVLYEEKVLFRRVKKGEHIHHVDGNKTNNDLSNLQLLTIQEHMRIHALQNYKNRKKGKNGQFT